MVVICGPLKPKEATKAYHAYIAKTHREDVEESSIPVEPAVIETVVAKPSLTVPSLRDKYVARKQQECLSGQIVDRTLMSIKEVLRPFAVEFAGSIDQMTPDDFASYTAKLRSKYSVYAVDRHITNVRAMFAWAVRNELLPRLPKWGDAFDKPSLSEKRKYKEMQRAKNGEKTYSIQEVHTLLKHANPSMKAMILLGINCGLGNHDIAQFTMAYVNKSTGMLDFPRPKTSQPRRAALWSETLAALLDVERLKPTPAHEQDAQLLFLTKRGEPMVSIRREASGDDLNHKRTDYIAQYFKALVDKAGVDRRRSRGFYSFRHTYRTIADATNDQRAVDLTMGHATEGMGSSYVSRIDPTRLKHVADYVHDQFFPPDSQYIVSSCSSL